MPWNRRLIAIALSIATVLAIGCNVDEADEALDGEVEDTFDVEFTDADLGEEPSEDAAVEPVSDECEEDTECQLASQTCLIPEGAMNGACGECLDNTFCPEERPYCNAEGICTSEDEGICRESLDCEQDPRLQCQLLSSGEVGFCVECLGDDDCVAPRPHCATTGLCVPRGQTDCENDDECGPLLNCVEANCVEP